MIIILDFGSQYTQLIARRVREARVYCEIHPYNLALDRIRALKPRGIILSGSPASLYDHGAPDIAPEVLTLGCPVLGICYGLYVIAQHLGAHNAASRAREYGPSELIIDERDPLFEGLKDREFPVWMSHGDRVEAIPEQLARSPTAPILPTPRSAAATECCAESSFIRRSSTRRAARRSCAISSIGSAASPATGRWRISSKARRPRFARASGREIAS